MDDDERTAADHRKSAEAHDESATRHDRAAADSLARGDAERAGRELLDALIERQLAKDERERAGLEDEDRFGTEPSRGRSTHHRTRESIVAEQTQPTQPHRDDTDDPRRQDADRGQESADRPSPHEANPDADRQAREQSQGETARQQR